MPRTRSNIHAIFLLTILCLTTALLFMMSGADSPEKRTGKDDAYLAGMKFKVALHEERWDDALGHCSPTLNDAAAKHPSPQAFFERTTPLKLLRNQELGAWRTRSGRAGPVEHGHFVKVPWPKDPAAAETPSRLLTKGQSSTHTMENWYFTHARTHPNAKWLFNWEPVPVAQVFEDRRQLQEQWDTRVETFREGMQEKFDSVEVRLVMNKTPFERGKRIPLQIDVVNGGEQTIYFVDLLETDDVYQVIVRSEDGSAVRARHKPLPPPQQILVHGQRELVGGETERICKINLQDLFEIDAPGIYTVQHQSRNIVFGDQMVFEKNDPFAEHKDLRINMHSYGFSRYGFVSSGKPIPSNTLQFEVRESE